MPSCNNFEKGGIGSTKLSESIQPKDSYQLAIGNFVSLTKLRDLEVLLYMPTLSQNTIPSLYIF